MMGMFLVLIGWMFAKPEPADETAKTEEPTSVEGG